MSRSVPEHWRRAALDPPRAFGAPVISGSIRVEPEDFEVHEELPFEPDGEGAHWLIHIRKRNANTEWVAKALARHAGLRSHEIGFAGLKDRHALAWQWFSVLRGRVTAEDWLGLTNPEFEVLAVHAHGRKLRRGAHAGNRFRIRIKSATGAPTALDERLAAIAARGVPNYFGPQRFGRGASNLERLQEWGVAGHAPASRHERSLTLSAGRSVLFNASLAQRVRGGTWEELLDGDVANLEGSGSIFAVHASTPDLEDRCAALDIHPTGPLWGAGELRTRHEVLELETAVAASFHPLPTALVNAGLVQERRSLRLRVEDLAAHYSGGSLTLEFRLPAGAFATTVLRELMGTGPDVRPV